MKTCLQSALLQNELPICLNAPEMDQILCEYAYNIVTTRGNQPNQMFIHQNALKLEFYCIFIAKKRTFAGKSIPLLFLIDPMP
jgi:hypothetical protein